MGLKDTPTFSGTMLDMIRLLATFFYLGKSPKIPGTVGTLGAVPVVAVLALMGPLPYMLASIIITLAALIIAQFYESKYGVHDAQEIVIDEVAGYVIAMAWLPYTWQSFVAAFLLFRLFDGLKPFPIGWLDKNVKGGVGVVVDDVVAGIITNIILQVVFVKTPWLGIQLT